MNNQNYNQYQQNPYGNIYNDPHKYISPEDNKKANIISTISIILALGVPILLGVMGWAAVVIFDDLSTTQMQDMSNIGEIITVGFGLISWGSRIAALALMIYVRVKYPNNIFGKVLMWIYIALIVIGIIVLSVVIISCGIAFGACVNGMRGCGEIGAKFIGILWR